MSDAGRFRSVESATELSPKSAREGDEVELYAQVVWDLSHLGHCAGLEKACPLKFNSFG